MEDELDAGFNDSFSSDNLSFILYNNYDFQLPASRLPTFILFLLVCLVGLISNALVLFVILWCKKMWRIMNVFIFSLALGDLLYMLCLLSFAIELKQPLSTCMCKLYWTLTALTTFSSVYFLAIMSLSVFLQTYFPAFSKKLKLRAAALISLGIWILGLLLGIPLFLYADLDEFFDCQFSLPETAFFWNMTVISYRFSVAFLAPLILASVFLILTHCRVRRQDQSNDSTVIGIKEDTVMITVLSLVFIVFWLPIHLIEIISAATKNWMAYGDWNYYVISVIPYLKSCIYPFLYGFLSRNFKDLYSRIFCCKKVQESDDPEYNSTDRPEDKSTVC
ncbi:hypothetical protein GDO78_020092 [Eleutherodactylus coqui]|uniref:G-protein coupled receptors family 1 profile domain-containing protein n=1 Tax=Eleutherodactylus coqui TaxID=57060 RepID=A0A8J6JY13_ELECQ|nr:hypothetical protein GDO78_020092 [Eleutherodactylus coqui]